MAVGSGKLPPLNAVAGVQLGVASAGIKTVGRHDTVVISICEGAAVAGVFTQNAFCAAPVHVAKAHLKAVMPRFLLVNTGNANAGTGDQGMKDAQSCCQQLAELTGVSTQQVLPFSTGVIGEHLPVEKITAALPAAIDNLRDDAWQEAASGIMTTDTRPKASSLQCKIDGKLITVTGITKGAGMIKPNMATMLGYVATDAAVSEPLLAMMIQTAVNQSFNRITVDGDTSTNDACMLIATNKAGNTLIDSVEHPDYAALQDAISEVFIDLAQQLVRDGEGATKFVTVSVAGGASEAECLAVAYTVAESPLVKTALFASDPNWGRLLAAIGRAGVENLQVEGVSVCLNGVLIAEKGCRAGSYTEEQGQAVMNEESIVIEIDLGRGSVSTTVWTTDLSHEYVTINADYRT